jgi:hypothetical protein
LGRHVDESGGQDKADDVIFRREQVVEVGIPRCVVENVVAELLHGGMGLGQVEHGQHGVGVVLCLARLDGAPYELVLEYEVGQARDVEVCGVVGEKLAEERVDARIVLWLGVKESKVDVERFLVRFEKVVSSIPELLRMNISRGPLVLG